jgi:8-oxo-dGTP diphosphatase
VEPSRVQCVGGIVTDASGRILLVLRGKEPDRGCWSIPGGHIEPGETDAEATAREVLEETGLHVLVGDLVGAVERDLPDGSVLVIRDYRCVPVDDVDPSVVRGADDADDAGWFTTHQLRAMSCSPGLVEALETWGVLPAAQSGQPDHSRVSTRPSIEEREIGP